MSYCYTISDHDIHALAYLKCPRKIAQYLGTTTARVELGLSRARKYRKDERIADTVKLRPAIHKTDRIASEDEQPAANRRNREATIALGQAVENYWIRRMHRGVA